VFHMDVAKIDRDVAYVSMIVHVCFKLLFPMFHLFFKMYVASMFIWMLGMLHTYIASVFIWMLCMDLQWFSSIFHVFLQVCIICLQTYVASVASICFKSRSGIAHVAM
jgi:hypothetical protein